MVRASVLILKNFFLASLLATQQAWLMIFHHGQKSHWQSNLLGILFIHTHKGWGELMSL